MPKGEYKINITGFIVNNQAEVKFTWVSFKGSFIYTSLLFS